MSGTFKFDFEELPLVTELGFEAGLVNGSANISYCDDGEFFVKEIYLDGFKGNECKPVEIDARKSWLFLTIFLQLDSGKFAGAIKDKISAALDEDEVPRNSDSAEHGTHFRAFSGVA